MSARHADFILRSSSIFRPKNIGAPYRAMSMLARHGANSLLRIFIGHSQVAAATKKDDGTGHGIVPPIGHAFWRARAFAH